MKTHITFVLDRSGSMETVKSDTIGGFNAFLDEQKKVAGECTVTLVQFDTLYDVVYNAKPLRDVPHLTTETFQPRGATALLDATGRAINETGAALSALPDGERPARIVFVVLTDGYENSSKEFTADKIKSMLEHQRDVYQWEFVYLGADQNAWDTAKLYGFTQANVAAYAGTSAGVNAAFAATASNAASYRSGATRSMAFSDEQRKKLAKR